MKIFNWKVYNGIDVTFFAGASIFIFVDNVIVLIFGLHVKGIGHVGPYYLNEIPWDSFIVHTFVLSILVTLIVSAIDKDMRNTPYRTRTAIGRANNKMLRNIYAAIYFYSLLFLLFFIALICREYFVRDLGITLIRFCSTEIPWDNILSSSFIFGTITAIGFYNTTEKIS